MPVAGERAAKYGALNDLPAWSPRDDRQVAEDRRDCYWLYVVISCKSQGYLQEPIKNPARFPWHEVRKVDHYYLSVDALTQPMTVHDEASAYAVPKN